jgi:DNA-binding transcriptional LysR family regulator
VTGDPLRVRSPDGMLPTPRALELAEPVRQALALLSRAVSEHETFVPERASGNFRIALLDHSAFVFMPRIVTRLAELAPKVSVEAVAWRGGDLNYRELQAGEIDLLLSVGSFAEAPAGIYRRRLFADRFMCLVREGHPSVNGKLDLKTYCELSHVLVSPRGGRRGIVDDALDARGLSRCVAVVVPHFMVAPFLVSRTDFIVTISEYVARPLGALLPLALHEPPLDFAKGSWFQLWHERTHYDPAHKWFREQVAAIAVEVEQEVESDRCPRPAKQRTEAAGAKNRQMKRAAP